MSIEKDVKSQYAKFFTEPDYPNFKFLAEYYFDLSAKLLTTDVKAPKNLRLMIRNIQKRLFIGIGTELLLKAVFLYCGFGINKPNSGSPSVYKLKSVDTKNFAVDNTFTLDFLISQLSKVYKFKEHSRVVKGLNVAKVFRNKEGHVITLWHHFDPQNYSDVEYSVISIYSEILAKV
ncbi:MAG: hypothetical protein HS100_13090 [Anaerolineales bacterium]|nr:hypothetical protein [Anaerolineales bacterium]